ncbi:uL15 family ribosomal protein [Candidatus Woesearchaeota archaeon]|nr:uL15 family ribosomal protein [Candidatus Woesearchaeota archaeon]
MIRKRKKNIRFRGYKTHGWGSKKKHRNSGNRGGFGMAGSGKRADQRKSFVLKVYGPGYFGKNGFVRHSGLKIKEDLNVINTGELDRFEGNEIDLGKHGYGKLLGKGNVNKKIKVIVKSASNNAIEKIKNAGGEVIIKQ